jgi:hypothetical protein
VTQPHSKICVYCGEPALTGEEEPEHPIPAAIGSSLTVPNVCDPCNRWAGVHVDQPFLQDDWVLLHRAQHDIRDPRRPGRPVPHPLKHGTTDDGVRVTVDDEGRPHLGSRIVERPDGTARIIASTMEEAQRLLARFEQRAAEQGYRVERAGSGERQVRPVVNMGVMSDLHAWTRMGAKIALGIGSLAYDADWRLSPDADYLRRVMREGEDAGKVICPERVDDDHPFRRLVEPPEHAAFFLAGSQTKLAVVLFGALFFAVPVDSENRPTPRVAWRLDPRRPRASGQTTFDGLIERKLRYRTTAADDDEVPNAADDARRLVGHDVLEPTVRRGGARSRHRQLSPSASASVAGAWSPGTSRTLRSMPISIAWAIISLAPMTRPLLAASATAISTICRVSGSSDTR